MNVLTHFYSTCPITSDILYAGCSLVISGIHNDSLSFGFILSSAYHSQGTNLAQFPNDDCNPLILPLLEQNPDIIPIFSIFLYFLLSLLPNIYLMIFLLHLEVFHLF